MTDIPNEAGAPDNPAPQTAAQATPYPTVQILQSAMEQRESIRRSFESQRESLAKAILQQRETMTKAISNTRENTSTLDSYLQSIQNFHAATAAESANAHAQAAKARAGEAAANPTSQQFLDALHSMIAEEIARQLAQTPPPDSASKTGYGLGEARQPQQPPAEHDGPSQNPGTNKAEPATATIKLATGSSQSADSAVAVASPTAKLAAALNVLTSPDKAVAGGNQLNVAMGQFLEALKSLIAEEISRRQARQNPAEPEK